MTRKESKRHYQHQTKSISKSRAPTAQHPYPLSTLKRVNISCNLLIPQNTAFCIKHKSTSRGDSKQNGVFKWAATALSERCVTPISLAAPLALTATGAHRASLFSQPIHYLNRAVSPHHHQYNFNLTLAKQGRFSVVTLHDQTSP